MPEQIETVCDECRTMRKTARTAKGLERLPKGWHRIETDGRPEVDAAFVRTYCEKCWNKKYVLRAVAIPVATALDATWPELWQEVRAAWKLTTQASNWMITELAKRDITRTSDMAKLPRPEPVSLYREATQRFPELPPQTIVALEHSIQGNAAPPCPPTATPYPCRSIRNRGTRASRTASPSYRSDWAIKTAKTAKDAIPSASARDRSSAGS